MASMQPRFHKLNTGDVFNVTIDAFASTPGMWNNPRCKIVVVHRKRPSKLISVFGHDFVVPCLRKEWTLQVEYR